MLTGLGGSESICHLAIQRIHILEKALQFQAERVRGSLNLLQGGHRVSLGCCWEFCAARIRHNHTAWGGSVHGWKPKIASSQG
jgi:hypothetical protein